MFSHFDRRGKCEWLEGGLHVFVSHYNRERGTAYSLTECLDILPIGPATPKQPEVLLTDKLSGKQMVIERKSVVWPPSYVRNEETFHLFGDLISESAKGWYRDGLYKVSVDAEQLGSLDKKSATVIARNIGTTLSKLVPTDLPMRWSTPINWSFRRIDSHQYGDRKGICVESAQNVSLQDRVPETAIAGTTSALKEQLENASRKFLGYRDKWKVVLLDFFGDELSEDDIPAMIERIAVPKNIDEIWRTNQVWISEDDFEVGYERIFER
jgi:hypothetical protein